MRVGRDVATSREALFTGTSFRRRSEIGSSRHAAGLSRNAVAETLESRVLLSAYSLGKVIPLGVSPDGNVAEGITIDATGNIFGATNCRAAHTASAPSMKSLWGQRPLPPSELHIPG